MSHSSPEASTPGSASEMVPDLRRLRAQLLDEFIEKCGPFRTALADVEAPAVKTLLDHYSFIVFNVLPNDEGSVIYVREPPVDISMSFRIAVQHATVETLKDYASRFNVFKANSAKRVINACKRLGKRKLNRVSVKAREAIDNIYRLAKEKNIPDLELFAARLADTRVDDFLKRRFMVVDAPLPHDVVAYLSEIRYRLLRTIDRSILAETLSKELKRISIVELKGDRKLSRIAFGIYLKIAPP